MISLNFHSKLAPHMTSLVNQKRALGYKYESQVIVLKKFDTMCVEQFPNECTVTRDMLDVWAIKQPMESSGTLRNRVTVISHLAQHMVALGIDSYIYPTNELPKEPKYIPYIFSKDELTSFFSASGLLPLFARSTKPPFDNAGFIPYFVLLWSQSKRSSEP